MRRYTLHHQLFRLFNLLILPFLYLLIKLAQKSPEAVEALYSQKLFPVIRDVISAPTRVLPFSLAEALIVFGGAFIVIFLLIRLIRVIFFRREALLKLLSLVITYVLIAAYLAFAFYAVWGFNYFRPSIGRKLDLPERQYTAEQLEAVCLDLLSKASDLRERVLTDEDGVFKVDFDSVRDSVKEAYTAFGASRPSFKTDVPKAKPVYFSEFLSQCGISGIFIGFTEEPNVNTYQPSLYIPFSSAHETAHYLGFAREEDANFLAFLVCMNSSDPQLAYSGYMHALVGCGNALSSADSKAYSALRSAYSEGMERDIKHYTEYLDRYREKKIYQTANDLNDSYLKLNDQEKGVLSYNEDTALILRYYDSLGFFG